MAEKDIPDEVKKFIFLNINSLEQLEVLLFLHKYSENKYSSAEIAQELRTNPGSTEEKLKEIYSLGILNITDKTNPFYQYNQANKYIVEINMLAKAYRDYKHTVITLIFSKPLDNIRSFADAFKLKKDETDG